MLAVCCAASLAMKFSNSTLGTFGRKAPVCWLARDPTWRNSNCLFGHPGFEIANSSSAGACCYNLWYGATKAPMAVTSNITDNFLMKLSPLYIFCR